MEDNAPVCKEVCNKAYKSLNWTSYAHPPNSPDLNPIDNIHTWIKHIIIRKYWYVASKAEMMRIIQVLWDGFSNHQ